MPPCGDCGGGPLWTFAVSFDHMARSWRCVAANPEASARPRLFYATDPRVALEVAIEGTEPRLLGTAHRDDFCTEAVE